MPGGALRWDWRNWCQPMMPACLCRRSDTVGAAGTAVDRRARRDRHAWLPKSTAKFKPPRRAPDPGHYATDETRKSRQGVSKVADVSTGEVLKAWGVPS